MAEKVGRPNKYETEIKDKLILVEGWARDGLTNEQIATNLGINISTLYDYQKTYSEFSEALKKGKEVIDREVENALLKRALGYSYDEVTYEMGIEVKRVKKEVQPDTTAQIFWLKNRKRLEWRDKQDIEHSGNVTTTNVDLSSLSTEELKKLCNI